MSRHMIPAAALAASVLLALAAPVHAATPLIFSVTGNAASGRPVVEGVTNLPDGTQVLLTLSRKASGYLAQDKLKVQDGRFKSSQFSNRGEPLLAGAYTLKLVGPLAAVQPSSAALGANYANFTSPLLKRGSIGTTLEYQTMLTVPGQSNSAADAAARKTAEQDKAAWLKKSCSEIPGITERLTGKRMTQPETTKFVNDCVAGKVK